jgi:2-dehydro-3-deoxyphosphooctonate aldolase (KDO 8-P synthase)
MLGGGRLKIGAVNIGDGHPLALICGLNVIESETGAIESAKAIQEIARAHDFPLIFKASFDKANRSRWDAYRGPGLEAGLDALAAVKSATGLPLLTDVHEPLQAQPVADVVDCLQLPAFLCRQTDLVSACAATGLAINVKKGQFIAPANMLAVVEKLAHFGCHDVLITDRGTQFGYNALVTDFASFNQIRSFAPICFDATHAAQQPGTLAGSSGGDRASVLPLARAAAAVGIDALFLEAHPSPNEAPCDGPCQISFETLDRLLAQVRRIDSALRAGREDAPD